MTLDPTCFSIADLLELRKLRRAREGIDATKLTVGDGKKKRRRKQEGEEDDSVVERGGLRKGAPADHDEDDE
jgi:hypothetical protein